MIKHRPNLFHMVWFDPGGTTGWAHLVVDFKAFSRPEHRALRYVADWDCGEFTGDERQQCDYAIGMVWNMIKINTTMRPRIEVGLESFFLQQNIGGENLLAPVRINAVLDYELMRSCSLKVIYQAPSERTVATPERLRQFGFEGRWPTSGKGKDATSAMQHAVTRLKKLKEKSMVIPWKLESSATANAAWDCSCALAPKAGKPWRASEHDLVHP